MKTKSFLYAIMIAFTIAIIPFTAYSQNQAAKDNQTQAEDTLFTSSQDTTFLYDYADTDNDVYLDDDNDEIDDVAQSVRHEWIRTFGLEDTWFGRIIAGASGILVACILLFVFLFVLLFLTSPLWIIALIIWAVSRFRRKQAKTQQTYEQKESTQSSYDTQAQPAVQKQPITEKTKPAPMPVDENLEMWKSGIMYCCVGLGLIILFISLDIDNLWGVGALVACVGVAKLIISNRCKSHSRAGEGEGEYVQ